MHYLKLELTYDDLLNLAATLDRWTRTNQLPEDMANVGEALRAYASEVGVGWKPDTPKRLSLMAFIGKRATADRPRRAD